MVNSSASHPYSDITRATLDLGSAPPLERLRQIIRNLPERKAPVPRRAPPLEHFQRIIRNLLHLRAIKRGRSHPNPPRDVSKAGGATPREQRLKMTLDLQESKSWPVEMLDPQESVHGKEGKMLDCSPERRPLIIRNLPGPKSPPLPQAPNPHPETTNQSAQYKSSPKDPRLELLNSLVPHTPPPQDPRLEIVNNSAPCKLPSQDLRLKLVRKSKPLKPPPNMTSEKRDLKPSSQELEPSLQEHGRSLQEHGRSSPELGRSSSALGQSSPALGQSSPALGRSSPQQDRRLEIVHDSMARERHLQLARSQRSPHGF